MRLTLLVFLAALLLNACGYDNSQAPEGAAQDNGAADGGSKTSAATPPIDPARLHLMKAIANPARNPDYVARDSHRHPLETLLFFGVKPDDSVIEIWPGGGWYAEILYPYLKDEGHYLAAHFSRNSTHARNEAYFKRSRSEFDARSEASEDLLFGAKTVGLEFPHDIGIPADASVDFVLTFRNAHNVIRDEVHDDLLAAAWAALKPGGIYGVVDHRANPAMPIDPNALNGYVNQDEMIRLVEAAGFEFVAASEVNANPKDTADHPNGVWTLPPRLRLPEGESKDPYVAIGESDRFTLKFQKPAQ